MKFNIVPVFFNVGLDHEADLAEKLGLNGPQEKNNSDNFKIIGEYVRKFKQKNYFNHISKEGKYPIECLHHISQGRLLTMMKL